MARARGLASWQPRAKSVALLDQVKAVLREYSEHLPLTIRQIFYRLVGAYGYPKGTSKDRRPYLRLGEMLNRARRAELVSWSAIRDDGFEIKQPTAWDGVDDVLAAFRATIKNFRLDRQIGQRRCLLIAIEAQGMLPQIERITEPFGIPVVASGGFDSTSAKYGLSEFLGAMPAVEVLHIGDHDKEGQDIFKSLSEDVQKFCADYGWNVPEFTRLAVTAEQIVALGLADDPDNPGKIQAEAIPPDVLAEIVQLAIDDRLDEVAWQQVLIAEERAILDGMQRLNAVMSFIENDYAVGGTFFDLNTMAITKALFDDGKLEQRQPVMARDKCVQVASYLLPLSIYESADVSSIDTVFRRINSGGRKLSRQELRAAGSTGHFAGVVRKIGAKVRGDDSSSDLVRLGDMKKISIANLDLPYGINVDEIFWVAQGILTKDQVRESRDEELIADIVAYMVSENPISSRSEFIDDFFGMSDDDASQTRFNEVESLVQKRTAELVVSDFQRTLDEIKLTLESSCLTFGGSAFR